MLNRRAALAFALAGFLSPRIAYARGFPSGQVRLVVPFPAGGATDVLARVLAQHLQTLWKQTVIIENKPGANGATGAAQVAAGAADGHTILLGAAGFNLPVASKMPIGEYDVRRDLAPISLVAAPPYILVTNPKVPIKSIPELIAYAKANPGKLTYASSGVGAVSHLSGALLQYMTGTELLHVPYRGSAQPVTDLLAGVVDLFFAPALVVTSHVATGSLRALGVTSARKSPLFPDIAPIAESVPGFEALGWFGLFAPPATPSAILSKISEDVAQVLAIPDARKRILEQGAEPTPDSPTEFANHINQDVKKWVDLARKTGINLTP